MLQYASVSWADVVDDDEEWRPDHWQQVQQQQQLNTTGGTTPRDQNLSVATVAQKEVATPSAADDATTPSVSPIKNDNSPPTPKRTVYQQVIVASPIPYTFKSLGSMSAAPLSPAHQQPTPNKQLQEQQQQKQQQQQHPRPRPQQQQQQASSSKAKLAYATYWYHPTCYNYAVAELERALVEAGGELGYSDLMKACYWRARFQPTLGSLFTFLKKLKHKFAYKMTIVSLVGASAEEQQNLTASAPQVKQQQAAAVKEDPVSTPIVSELLTDWK